MDAYLVAPLTLRSTIYPLGLRLLLNGSLQMVIGGSQASCCRLRVATIQLRYLRGSHWIRGSSSPPWLRSVCVSRFSGHEVLRSDQWAPIRQGDYFF